MSALLPANGVQQTIGKIMEQSAGLQCTLRIRYGLLWRAQGSESFWVRFDDLKVCMAVLEDILVLFKYLFVSIHVTLCYSSNCICVCVGDHG